MTSTWLLLHPHDSPNLPQPDGLENFGQTWICAGLGRGSSSFIQISSSNRTAYAFIGNKGRSEELGGKKRETGL